MNQTEPNRSKPACQPWRELKEKINAKHKAYYRNSILIWGLYFSFRFLVLFFFFFLCFFLFYFSSFWDLQHCHFHCHHRHLPLDISLFLLGCFSFSFSLRLFCFFFFCTISFSWCYLHRFFVVASCLCSFLFELFRRRTAKQLNAFSASQFVRYYLNENPLKGGDFRNAIFLCFDFEAKRFALVMIIIASTRSRWGTDSDSPLADENSFLSWSWESWHRESIRSRNRQLECKWNNDRRWCDTLLIENSLIYMTEKPSLTSERRVFVLIGLCARVCARV